MSFRPSLHGWPFANDFRPSGFALGLGAPTFPELGLGGGMCWAALDRYLAGIRLPRELERPSEGDALHAELVARQVAAVGGTWERIRRGQSLPSGSWRDKLHVVGAVVPGGADLGTLSRGEWRVVRKRIDASEPVLLVLLEETDGYARSTAAWQVLAYGYTREGGRVTLSIYDPGRPEDDDYRLAFSLRGELDARLTGGRRIRGFMAVPYDRSAPRSLRGETFGDRSVIGMNRKVRGRLSCAPSRGGLDLVARDPDGALLHFRRSKGHWEGVNVTERESLGSHELYSDPVAVRAAGALHVFAKSYVGDLLHFTQRRGWAAANRTDTKRTGARFRLEGEPVPVALSGGAVSVVGRGKEGVLVHYTGVPFRGWTAEEVSAAGHHPLQGDPLAVRVGRTLHVVGRSRDGRVLHFERLRGGWSAADATQEAFPERTVRLVGRPALLLEAGALHVFGRDDEDRLIELIRDEEGRWSGSAICDGVRSDPAATAGPAGKHVFAVSGSGDLVHAWRGERWESENLGQTRACLPMLAVTAPLAAWGDAEELRVFGRAGGELWLWVWRPDSDWSAERAHTRAGMHQGHRTTEAPSLVVDASGRPHLFSTDGRGTVVHLEAGEWIEPDATRRPIKGVSAPSARGASAEASGARDGAPDEASRTEPAEESMDIADFEAEALLAGEAPETETEAEAADETWGADEPWPAAASSSADLGSADWQLIDGSGAIDLGPPMDRPAQGEPDPLDATQPLDLSLSLNGSSSEPTSGVDLDPGSLDAEPLDLGEEPSALDDGEEAEADLGEPIEPTASGAESSDEPFDPQTAFDPAELAEPDEEEEAPPERIIHRAPRARRGENAAQPRVPRKVVRLPRPLRDAEDDVEDEPWPEEAPLPLLEDPAEEPAEEPVQPTVADEADGDEDDEWDITAALDLPDSNGSAKNPATGNGKQSGKVPGGTGAGEVEERKPFRWEPDGAEVDEEDEDDPLDVNLMDAWPESSRPKPGETPGSEPRKRKKA